MPHCEWRICFECVLFIRTQSKIIGKIRKSNDNRRKLLQSITAGSGAVVVGKALPESWSKPAINSVMLPAHTATTNDSGSAGGDATENTYFGTASGVSIPVQSWSGVRPFPELLFSHHQEWGMIRLCCVWALTFLVSPIPGEKIPLTEARGKMPK